MPPEDLRVIIICEGYDDFLAVTLNQNALALSPQFPSRNIVVVTTLKDKATREVAIKNGATCVISYKLHEGGAPFAKGKAINEAIKAIQPTGWVLLLDADILLPKRFCKLVELKDLNRDKLYYVARHENKKPADFKPLGYFQLFHVEAKSLIGREITYPEKSRIAGGDDDKFGLYVFSTDSRIPLKTFHVDHLPHGKTRENWSGRKSPRK